MLDGSSHHFHPAKAAAFRLALLRLAVQHIWRSHQVRNCCKPPRVAPRRDGTGCFLQPFIPGTVLPPCSFILLSPGSVFERTEDPPPRGGPGNEIVEELLLWRPSRIKGAGRGSGRGRRKSGETLSLH